MISLMPFVFPHLRVGLSERADGSMKLLRQDQVDPVTASRRTHFFEQQGMDPQHVVIAHLVHGTHVAVVTLDDGGQFVPETDGLVTNQVGVILAVTVADCVPVYFYDPVRRAIGLAHSGWRGTLKRIVPEVMRTMQEQYGSRPDDMHVLIGPCIQQHHFEVQQDVAQMFQAYIEQITHLNGRILVDLSSIIQRQLVDVGVPIEHIEQSEVCTYCEEERYFSYRRDKPEIVEAMVAYIGMTA